MIDNPDSASRSTASRRTWLKGIAIGAATGLAGCSGSGGDGSGGNGEPSGDGGGGTDGGTTTRSSGSGGGTQTLGISVKALFDPFMQTLMRTAQWYAEDNGFEVMTANAESDAAQQNQQVRNMLNSGIDALLISPHSSDAAVAAVEQATEQDVPVFTFNSTANSSDVKLFTSFGNEAAAYQAGQEIGSMLQESGGGSVFEVQGDPADQAGVLRSRGFHRAIKEFDNVEIVSSAQTDWTRQQSTEVTRSYLQKNKDIDAIYGAGGPQILGPLQALEQEGMKAKTGEEGHVILGGIDGFPEVLTQIQNGYVDLAIDQPNQLYGALSIEYMMKYLESGDESVLPEADSKVTSDDVTFNGNQHAGVNPWEQPPSSYWAPADVLTYSFEGNDLHPQIKTQALTVTQENVGNGYLWGKLAERILS